MPSVFCLFRDLSITIIILLIPGISVAHNALLATYQLSDESGSWQLRVSTTLSTLHHSLSKKYSKEQLISNDKHYNESIVWDYLLAHIRLRSKGHLFKLKPVTAQFNHHQSVFVFEIDPGETLTKSIDAKIDAMSDNPGQHNLLRIRTGGKQSRLMLSPRNSYQGELVISP